jgi:hypothetical protein
MVIAMQHAEQIKIGGLHSSVAGLHLTRGLLNQKGDKMFTAINMALSSSGR